MEYEIFIWLKGSLGAEQVRDEAKLLEKSLNGSLESLGRSRLAYKIKGLTEGHKFKGLVKIDRAKVAEAKTVLNRNENVLRYLLTKVSSKGGSASGGKSVK